MRSEDEAAFADFVRAEGDRLVRTAFLFTGNWASAEDLLQSALLRTWRRWSALRDRGAAGAYVVRCMSNLSAAWWRRKWTGERPTAELPDALTADPYEVVDVSQAVVRAMRSLTARQRAVLVLRYGHDLSEAQVADALGCSVGTVKSTASRALRTLREADLWDGFAGRSAGCAGERGAAG